MISGDIVDFDELNGTGKEFGSNLGTMVTDCKTGEVC